MDKSVEKSHHGPNEKKRIYVKQKERETDYDRLNEWQKKAFEMMWAGKPQTEIAAAMKKSVAWISKFANSDIVKKIRIDRARSEYLDMAPLALRTLKGIMEHSESDVARKDAALKVLDKMALFVDEEKDKPTTMNLTQNVLNLSLDQIQGMKADVMKRIEAVLGPVK